MVSQRRKVLQPVALLLVIAVLQVFLVNPAKANAASDTSTNTAPSSLRFGQLLMSENQTALVNGTNATSGTTIFSGAQLQTSDGVAATVQLGTLGRLAIDPNTQLSLTFDKGYIDVHVSAGNAVLTANAGVNGTLTTPEGKKLATNASATSTSTVGKRAAGKYFGGGDHLLGFVITAAVVTIAIIVIASDNNDNTSPR
jgi:ferric-dicitrate binding protein FerR (iron transport regulator)